MTDKELLQAAAKAAGVSMDLTIRPDGLPLFSDELGLALDVEPGWWNPLTDDGDALRLAVKLAERSPGASFDLTISKMYDGRGFASAGFRSRDNPSCNGSEPDVATATRRAIVRAAAAIRSDPSKDQG